MRIFLTLTLCLAGLLLSGCATTLRSNVAAYHEWPADLGNGNNTFTFEAPAAGSDLDGNDAKGIEYGQYQKQLSEQLVGLGLVDVSGSNQTPALKVSLKYSVKPIDMVMVIDPFFGSNSAAFAHPVRFPVWYSYPYWSRFGSRYGSYPGYYRHYGRPFYDPFWFYANQLPEENTAQRYQRKIEIGITRVADGKKLYEVTVDNASRRSAQAEVMPYLIQSAFVNFPGKSGEQHRVDIKLTE